MELLVRLSEAIIDGDARAATALTQEALDEGVDPQVIISDHLIPAMDEVGRRFESGDFFVPELLIAGRAMKSALALINPILAAQGSTPAGRILIGTVRGDLHDIGKNLVASMLEGAGFEVKDLGVDVSPEAFVDEVRTYEPGIVALSALLTTTMPAMKQTLDALSEAGIRDRVRIIIGGAPISQQYADEIGADGYSDNAAGAVGIVRTLMAKTA
jgi:5-methyltetrahydrofolate--homocysteine methyltransferase